MKSTRWAMLAVFLFVAVGCEGQPQDPPPSDPTPAEIKAEQDWDAKVAKQEGQRKKRLDKGIEDIDPQDVVVQRQESKRQQKLEEEERAEKERQKAQKKPARK